MISYITIGTGDVKASKRFYSAFLPALGYDLKEYPDGLSCTPKKTAERYTNLVELYIKTPFDGGPATAGNGTMIAFDAHNQQQVRELHAAAIAAGGSDEGKPGFRETYSAGFYVGYLRDPQGNKIAIFSDNPKEPGRDG